MKKILILLLFIASTITLIAQTAAKNAVTDKIPAVDCDNHVHNKLPADAPDRSPSGCEMAFDRATRAALRNAFSKALLNFPGQDWAITDTAVEALKEVSKASENYFFTISYYFNIDLRPESKAYQSWAEKNQALMEELRNPGENTFKKFTEFNYKMNNAIHIRFYVLVNDVSESIHFIKGGQQPISIPGAVYAARGPHAGSLSGGGEDASMDACLIVFGKTKISTQKHEDGSVSVNATTNFPKGVSRLTVQEVSVRIECNNELLDKILKETDFNAIADMIGK